MIPERLQMMPSERLKEIDALPEPDDFQEEWAWLISRVKQLEGIILQSRHRHSSNAYKEGCAGTCYACWARRAASLPEGSRDE